MKEKVGWCEILDDELTRYETLYIFNKDVHNSLFIDTYNMWKYKKYQRAISDYMENDMSWGRPIKSGYCKTLNFE